MRPGILCLFCTLSIFAMQPVTATAQSIPVDHFEGLRFDAPVPASVHAGQELPLSGILLETGWQGALFSFRPVGGESADIDLFVQHLPGRIDRSVVFASAAADTYEVILFGGAAGDGLEFRGLFSPFVVLDSPDPVLLPTRFFDGLLLQAPVPTQLPLGVAPVFAGQILDERIVSARFDLSREGQELGSIRIPITDGQFDQPLRFPVASAGPLLVQLVVGLQDGTFWGRGSFLFQITDDTPAAAAPAVLSAALLAGATTDIVIANRGGTDLLVLDAAVPTQFEVITMPGPIAPGRTGTIGVRYSGGGGDEGDLLVDTNDPLRPQRRVALLGVADGDAATSLAWERADEDGLLTALAPAGFQRFVLALFSPPHILDTETHFPFAVGVPPPAARPARPAPTPRERGEAIRARKAARLASEVRSRGRPAMRSAQTSYQVGDSRSLVFDDFPPVPRQLLQARVVALSDHAVAFVHIGTEADGGSLSVAQIQAHLVRFDIDYDGIVDHFGAPSDVDGDDRIAFVYTPLVDDVGLGGFQDPASVLQEEFGGSGNLIDLLFLSPTQPASSYRSLLVHEFQHLINFHQHVLIRGGAPEATWLDEGLSHVAEDLVDGFAAGGNSDNVSAFLANPGAVGLTAQDHVTSAERGAGYLFVRSLVDRFGEGILLRLVQTGLSDRDSVEEAAGVPFRELLAGFAVRLYASGTDLAGHSRFSFSFSGLGGRGTRGFPQPAILRTGADAELAGSIRPRGVAFVEVTGTSIRLQAPVAAELGAVSIGLPLDFVARVDIPIDHFAGVRFDTPLPGVFASGDPVVVRGQVLDATLTEVTAQYSVNGDAISSFDISVADDGHFSRTILLDHDQVGDLAFDLFVGNEEGSTHAGSFAPVIVTAGADPILLPVGFFDGVLLDAPLPTRIQAGASVPVSGQVTDAAVDGVLIELVDGDDDRVSFSLPVEASRFALDLAFGAELIGPWELRLFTGRAADFSYRGGFDIVVGEPTTTAVSEVVGSLPDAFALAQPYPNPFNASIVVPLQTAGEGVIDIAVYDLAGQRLVTLHQGWLPAGSHRLRWNGHGQRGIAAASGVYLIRANARDWQGSRKVLLLR